MTQQVSAGRVPTGASRGHMPGLVLFSQVMMFIVAGFLLVVAISEWADSFWLYERSFTIAGNHLVVWGFIDFVLACGAAYGAFALKDGKRTGQIITLTFAGVSAIRWLFYI